MFDSRGGESERAVSPCGCEVRRAKDVFKDYHLDPEFMSCPHMSLHLACNACFFKQGCTDA